jgi:hypothetical protein
VFSLSLLKVNRITFKNGINGCLDNYFKENPRKTIRVYGDGDWPDILTTLREWESKGYLRVLKDPTEAKDDEICVLMLSYIEQHSPWQNWP